MISIPKTLFFTPKRHDDTSKIIVNKAHSYHHKRSYSDSCISYYNFTYTLGTSNYDDHLNKTLMLKNFLKTKFSNMAAVSFFIKHMNSSDVAIYFDDAVKLVLLFSYKSLISSPYKSLITKNSIPLLPQKLFNLIFDAFFEYTEEQSKRFPDCRARFKTFLNNLSHYKKKYFDSDFLNSHVANMHLIFNLNHPNDFYTRFLNESTYQVKFSPNNQSLNLYIHYIKKFKVSSRYIKRMISHIYDDYKTNPNDTAKVFKNDLKKLFNYLEKNEISLHDQPDIALNRQLMLINTLFFSFILGIGSLSVLMHSFFNQNDSACEKTSLGFKHTSLISSSLGILSLGLLYLYRDGNNLSIDKHSLIDNSKVFSSIFAKPKKDKSYKGIAYKPIFLIPFLPDKSIHLKSNHPTSLMHQELTLLMNTFTEVSQKIVNNDNHYINKLMSQTFAYSQYFDPHNNVYGLDFVNKLTRLLILPELGVHVRLPSTTDTSSNDYKFWQLAKVSDAIFPQQIMQDFTGYNEQADYNYALVKYATNILFILYNQDNKITPDSVLSNQLKHVNFQNVCAAIDTHSNENIPILNNVFDFIIKCLGDNLSQTSPINLNETFSSIIKQLLALRLDSYSDSIIHTFLHQEPTPFLTFMCSLHTVTNSLMNTIPLKKFPFANFRNYTSSNIAIRSSTKKLPLSFLFHNSDKDNVKYARLVFTPRAFYVQPERMCPFQNKGRLILSELRKLILESYTINTVPYPTIHAMHVLNQRLFSNPFATQNFLLTSKNHDNSPDSFTSPSRQFRFSYLHNFKLKTLFPSSLGSLKFMQQPFSFTIFDILASMPLFSSLFNFDSTELRPTYNLIPYFTDYLILFNSLSVQQAIKNKPSLSDLVYFQEKIKNTIDTQKSEPLVDKNLTAQLNSLYNEISDKIKENNQPMDQS